MRKFEAPYNFDKRLIPASLIYKDSIEFFYMSCYFEHGKDTRSYYLVDHIYPKTKEEYISHLDNIHDHGFYAAILLQIKITDPEIIKFYLENRVKYFIVAYDETAKIIRELDPTATIIASITQCLSIVDIEAKDENLYDRIVLYFPYNRNLSILKKLPKKFKYILMPNGGCSVFCNAKNHWFKEFGDKEVFCMKDTKDTMFIPAQYLSLYDEYIDYYKIDGRPSPSYDILDLLDTYTKAPIYDMSNPAEKKAFFDKYKNFKFIYIKEGHIVNHERREDKPYFDSLLTAPMQPEGMVNNVSFEERELYYLNSPVQEGYYESTENVLIHFNTTKKLDWFYTKH